MTWQPPSARERLGILKQAKTIAILGASDNPARASFFVGTYLLASTDYTVWFVNPMTDSILGHVSYPSLAALPGRPDIVDVFRKPSDLPNVLRETLDANAGNLWLQLGISDVDIAEQGHEAGIGVIMNRCIKIEHARFHGGLHLAGFNTGVISSRRSVT